MLIIIVVALLILALAVFQATQGIFSSLIMTILTVLCAVVAFNYYEPLAEQLHEAQGAYAEAVALVAVFVVPLLVLRSLADWAIRHNVILSNDMTSVWIGRVVAGAMGLVSSSILMGVLMVAVQLLPYSQSIVGYEPYDGALQRKMSLAPFYPDEFTLGLVGMLSEGAFSGERKWSERHNDLALEAFCNRTRETRRGRVDAPRNAIRVTGVENLDPKDPSLAMIGKNHPAVKAALERGQSLCRVTVLVSLECSDRDPNNNDDRLCLPGTQFRLVSEKGKDYYPIAGAITGIVDEKGVVLSEDPKDAIVIFERGEDRGVKQFGDRLERYVEAAKKIPGEKDKDGKDLYDLTALAVYARKPDSVMTSPDGKITYNVRHLRTEWIYLCDAGDSNDPPRMVVFRRSAKSAVPPKAPTTQPAKP